MLFVRSLVSKRYTYVIAVILLLSKIMPTYFHCVLKGLVYIAIITFLDCQPSSYTKYTKLNIYLFCNIRLVFIIKYIFFIHSCVL